MLVRFILLLSTLILQSCLQIYVPPEKSSTTASMTMPHQKLTIAPNSSFSLEFAIADSDGCGYRYSSSKFAHSQGKLYEDQLTFNLPGGKDIFLFMETSFLTGTLVHSCKTKGFFNTKPQAHYDVSIVGDSGKCGLLVIENLNGEKSPIKLNPGIIRDERDSIYCKAENNDLKNTD